MAGHVAAMAKKSSLYLQQFRSTLRGFSRASLISTGAAAYKAAVAAAWQDSGRAAHNLHLSVGERSFEKGYDSSRGTPPVGEVREQRSMLGGEKEVIEDRYKTYGIREGGDVCSSSYLKEHIGDPNDKAMYFGFIKANAFSKYRSVSIYSPIGSKFGTYQQRAYSSQNRGTTVREAMRLAATEELAKLRFAMKGKTKEQVDSFLKRNYQ